MRTLALALVAALTLAGCMTDDTPAADPAPTPAATTEAPANGTTPEMAEATANATAEVHEMEATPLAYAGRTDTGGCIGLAGTTQCHFENGENVLTLLPPNAMHLNVNLTWTPSNPAHPELMLTIVPIIDGEPQWGAAVNHTVTGPSPISVDWHLGEFMGTEFGLGVTSSDILEAGPVFLLREVSQDFSIEGTLWTMPDTR